MQVILLERIPKLGQMGDTVRVRDGFARNFLLPKGKALRATASNKERFEHERVHLEARNLERKSEAQAVGEKLEGKSFTAIRQAGETGQLYGSVTQQDIADLLAADGFARSAPSIPPLTANSNFGKLIAGLQNAADPKAMVDDYFAHVSSYPLIEDKGLVHFVYRGEA